MVATVEICESNGAETITHAVSNINFGSNDSANLVVATYPITVGNYSFTKYIRIHWSAGTANKLDNFRAWKSAGTYLASESITCNLKTSSYTSATYATPATASWSDVAMPVADPGNPNVGISGSLTSNMTSTAYSDYIKMQLQTTVDTPPGSANQKTFTFQYDEQ